MWGCGCAAGEAGEGGGGLPVRTGRGEKRKVRIYELLHKFNTNSLCCCVCLTLVNPPPPPPPPPPRLRRRADQALREAQDEAFEASLAADRAKQRDREAEEERVRKEQEREREREKEEARKVREFAEQRSESVGRLPIEPESGDPDTLHVILRLPSGQRLERRFSTHDSLQVSLTHTHTTIHGSYEC